MSDKELKAVSKLNKDEALAELEVLNETVEYEDGSWDENTPVKDLRQLVKEGREVMAEDDEEEGDGADGEGEGEDGKGDERITPTASTSEAGGMDNEEGDYLVQYQYKKETPFGTVATNPDKGSRAERQKKFLLSEKRAGVFIPAGSGDPKIKKSITINGYRLDLPKQTYLELPLSICGVIMDSEKQTVAALQPYRIDRERVVDGVPISQALG